MKFNLTLNSYQLADLKAKLAGLITEMDYDADSKTLNIASSDPANEPRIVDIVASVTRISSLPLMDEPAIDYAELARKAQREKRQAAALEKADMARIRAKRARQAMAVKI